MNKDEITALVRQVVVRTLGQQSTQKMILSAEEVGKMPANSQQEIPANMIITPLARQMAMERQISLLPDSKSTEQIGDENAGNAIVAIGADHGGFTLKSLLKTHIETLGYQIIDCGTHSTDSVDYPDYAYAVAQTVASGRAWRGIMIDGAGIGSCMTANKIPGVRAAMCYDQATAVNSREHNNANLLTLGAGLIGNNLAKQIVESWLSTAFGGGRHARRVDKITAIGKRYTK